MKIFISSPYTKGDQGENVRVQLDAANEIMNLGHFPFVPLLSHFQHIVHPRPYGDWLANDMAWLECCDLLLRLPGESLGADVEVERAKQLGIEVIYTLNELR